MSHIDAESITLIQLFVIFWISNSVNDEVKITNKDPQTNLRYVDAAHTVAGHVECERHAAVYDL